MWYNSSIALDMTFLELLPFFRESAVQEYPVLSDQLKKLVISATEQTNIRALIGATRAVFLKNELPNLKRNLPVINLSNIDRIFYIISQPSMTRNKQNDLLRYVSLVIERWFSQLDKKQLEDILKKLKQELSAFNKVLQFTAEIDPQRNVLIKQMLKIFVTLMDNQLTRDENYSDKFNQHGNFIYKNKKQVFLLIVMFEIQYLLVRHINKVQQLTSHLHLQSFLNTRIFAIQNAKRFSIIAQSIAFVLRKLFVVNLHCKMDSEVYQGFLQRIYEIIDNSLISKTSLAGKTEFYAFHMKDNCFFHYLEGVIERNTHNQSQTNIISGWKEDIRMAIQKSVPLQKRQIHENHIQEAIFYLQLRDKERFLWGNSNEINQFPAFSARIVKRMRQNSILEGMSNASDICRYLFKEFETNGLEKFLEMFNKSNIFVRAILFYCIHYCENQSFLDSKLTKANAEFLLFLSSIKQNISNLHLCQLLEFYLFEIELGNYYKISLKRTLVVQNSVNRRLYESIQNLLFQRLINSLTSFKVLEKTEDLDYLKLLGKYWVLLQKGLNFKQFGTPFICKGCKQIVRYPICSFCKYICLGVQLYQTENIFNMSMNKDTFHQLNKLRKKVKEVYFLIVQELQNNNVQWLYMFVTVLQHLLPI